MREVTIRFFILNEKIRLVVFLFTIGFVHSSFKLFHLVVMTFSLYSNCYNVKGLGAYMFSFDYDLKEIIVNLAAAI